jgi:hypothetical protein
VLPASHIPYLKKTPDKLPCPGRPQVQEYDQTPRLRLLLPVAKKPKESPEKYRFPKVVPILALRSRCRPSSREADPCGGDADSLNLKLMWLTLSSLSLTSLTCGSTSDAHAHAGTTQDNATTCVDVCCRCARNSHWKAR